MSIVVQRRLETDPREVWPVLADVESWAAWLPTVDEVTADEPGRPPGVGRGYRVRQPRLPRARWTITEWSAGEGFVWASRAPGVTATAGHRVRPAPGGGSEVELSVAWSGPGAWLVRLLYGRLTRRYVEAEAAALAEQVGRAAPPGPGPA